MNKSQLVDTVASKFNLPRKKVEKSVDLVFDSMAATMAGGGRVEIRGIGSFAIRYYGAYTGRNPRTGEEINVKPKKLPYFKVGKELKLRVREG